MSTSGKKQLKKSSKKHSSKIKKEPTKSSKQTTLTDHDFSAHGYRLNSRRVYPNLFNPHDSTRMREVKDGIREYRNFFRSTLNTGSYPDDTPTIADNDPTIVHNDPRIVDNDTTIVDNDTTIVDNDPTNGYSQTLIVPDTNIRNPINRSTNNGDKLWIDINIPENKGKYNFLYSYVNEEVKEMEKISKKNGENIQPVIYAYKVIKDGEPAMKKYIPGYGVWEEVKSKVFRDYEDTKFYVEYLYNRTESNDEDVYNLNPVEESRVKNDILLLFRGEIDKRYPLTYKYDEEPTYLVDHCDRKYGDPKYGCPISTYIYKSKIPYPNAKAGGFKRKSKKVKKKSKKVKKNVSKRI